MNRHRYFIVMLCLAVFGVSATGGFLAWDDHQHFLLNPHLIAGDVFYFWKNAYYGFYVPVVYTVWTALFGLTHEPWIFHALNLILHACNSLLVFSLTKRILKSDDRTALLSALVFALHPLQSEPVAWISGGRDLLAAFFGLSATRMLLVRASAGRTLFKQSSVLLFALGLLSKPSLAALPFALFALDLFKRERSFDRRMLGLLMALSLGLLAYTLKLQAPFSDPRLAATLFERFLVAVDALGFYVKSLAWPWPLSFSYDRQIETILNEKPFAASTVFVAIAMLILTRLARRFGRIVFGTAAFALILLLPVLGLVPFAGQVQSTVFDRYMYLPLFGFALLAAHVAQSRVARAVLGALIVLMAGLSFVRAREWRDDRTLTESALEINPRNYIALNNLAIQEIQEKNYKTAEKRLRLAWDTRPKEALAAANLAHALWLQNDVGSVLAEIKPLTETKIFLEYNQREVESLAMILRMTARSRAATLDREGARGDYLKALAYRPDEAGLQTEFDLFTAEMK